MHKNSRMFNIWIYWIALLIEYLRNVVQLFTLNDVDLQEFVEKFIFELSKCLVEPVHIIRRFV